MRHVGLAFDWRLFDPGAIGGAVSAFEGLRRVAIELDEHGVINVSAERAFNRFQIGLVAVAGQLDAIHDPRGHILDKPLRAFAIATADKMRNEQFRIGLNRGPCPRIAGAINRRFHIRRVLLLRADERPNFVNLNLARLHAAHLGVMEASAEASGIHKELGDGVDAGIRQARNGAHRSTFAEHGEDLGAGFGVELVHAQHNMNFHA